MKTLRWHYKPAQYRASGGTTFCRVSKCARLTRPNGLFFYSGCGESSRIVDFSWLYASTPAQEMSTRKKVNPRDAIMNVTEPQPILSSFATLRISLPPSLCKANLVILSAAKDLAAPFA